MFPWPGVAGHANRAGTRTKVAPVALLVSKGGKKSQTGCGVSYLLSLLVGPSQAPRGVHLQAWGSESAVI